MKIIQSKSYKAARFDGDEWNYKGHQCSIEMDHERDHRGQVEVSKAYHKVITPDGKELHPDITPYDRDRSTVNMWIDAGYPSRQDGRNYDKKSLQALLAQKGQAGHKGILPPKDNNTPWLTNQEPPKGGSNV